uniref:Peptidase metallopeptidase domain-containing protein n=1 Tax=Alexandrium andersonii TaxID=327968 RepID=A0A7S2CJW2_9DINO
MYTIGHLPGYLSKTKAHAEIQEAFEQWGNAVNINFAYTGAAVRARLRVDFECLAAIGEALGGGLARPGGQLAEATRKGVKLDAAERWLLRRQAVPERHPKAVHLFPVLLHEIGHVLGLAHSSGEEDVMWPYLKSGAAAHLSANDISRARELMGAPVARSSLPAASADGDIRKELAELRGDVAAMRAEMKEMSRVIAAAFEGSPVGSGAKAVAGCCKSGGAS